MSILDFSFPLIYTALYIFGVLFLVKTTNRKFYAKVLFSLFVFCAATWGWAEILQNIQELRLFAFWYTKVGFASALLGVEILFLLSLELLNLRIRFQKWYFYLFLLLLPGYSFLPDFIVKGFEEVESHLAIMAGYADLFYSTAIILLACATLFLFDVVFRMGDVMTQKRMKPVIFSFIITLVIGTAFNIFIPTVYGREEFTSFAPLAMVSLVAGMSFSILRWNLLGITLTKQVSRTQINQLWKNKSRDLYDQIREAFSEAEKLLHDPKLKVKKIIFSGGTVNQYANVHLYYPRTVIFLFFVYKLLGKTNRSHFIIFPNFVIILSGSVKGLDLADFQKDIASLFSQIIHFQRSAEGAILNHIDSLEIFRRV